MAKKSPKHRIDTICWTCEYSNDICPFHRKERKLVEGCKYIEDTMKIQHTGKGKHYVEIAKVYIITECPKYKKHERKNPYAKKD